LGSTFDPCPPTLTTRSAESAYKERIVGESLGVFDQSVESLVVTGRRQAQMLRDGRTLRARQRPPALLEREDGPITVGECHSDKAGLPS
jgi:hypothetical protein